MSFSVKDGNPICIVRGGKSDGEIIFVTDKEDSGTVIQTLPTRMITIPDGKFEQVPSLSTRVLYIAGPSGSGKSTYASYYIKKYIKVYIEPVLKAHKKKCKEECSCRVPRFYLFSKIDQDKVLDELDPIRVRCDESVISNPFNIKEIEEGSICLFDDIDCIENTKIQKVVNNLKAQILDLGRHSNVHCVITSHLINGNDRNATRTTLNEMASLTIFPQAGSAYQIKYCLKNYFGLSSKQIARILNIESRWVTIFKSYPQICLSEKEVMFVSELEGQRGPSKKNNRRPNGL